MIRNLKRTDKENWAKLYNGYAKFYKAPMNAGILDTLWGWIHDETHDVNAICFELEGRIVGIAHYRTMPKHTTTFIEILRNFDDAQKLLYRSYTSSETSLQLSRNRLMY